jgi:hypothetical protein
LSGAVLQAERRISRASPAFCVLRISDNPRDIFGKIGAEDSPESDGDFLRQPDRDFSIRVPVVCGKIDRRSRHSPVFDLTFGELSIDVDGLAVAFA